MTRCLFPIFVCAAVAIDSAGKTCVAADELPFTIGLKEVFCPNAPALHSFAVAQDRDGRWIFFGGRTAGLHGQRNTGETEPIISNFENLNGHVWVVDIGNAKAKSRTLADLKLPPSMAASLTVTGAQFVQVNDKLYILGGYGFNEDHTFMMTHRRLTVVDVEATVGAILNQSAVGSHIRQSAADEYLRVTGGELECLGGTFVLIFGQSFDFAYTPFTKGRYTHQVRTFRVLDDGNSVSIAKGVTCGSEASNPQFRRRDLNVSPAIRTDGRIGLTAFGGVFTHARGAWYRPIDIDVQAGQMNVSLWRNGFLQQLCQYNCAILPIHQGSTTTMYSVFFGGISAVYFTPGGLFQADSGLPFVDHVGCISTAPAGAKEWLVCRGGSTGPPSPLLLPNLLGAGAHLLPKSSANGPALFNGGVLELDNVQKDTTIGYIYGGIAAERNNNGPTKASNRIFEVHVSPQPSRAIAVPTVVPVEPPNPSPQSVAP